MLNKSEIARLKQMGFSKDDIDKASKIAIEKNIDIIDVLTKSNANPSNNQSLKPPGQNNQFVYRMLIKPRNQIVMDEYDCIYRQNDYTSLADIDDRREQGIPVALKNVSNCCYLNSLLQMFFLMPQFVQIVLEARPVSKQQLDQLVSNGIRNKRIFNSFSLLKSLQMLYSNMILTTKKSLDPSDILRNLVDSLGNKISYGDEKDLGEISLQFISRLQQCVLYTEGNTQKLPSFWESPEKQQFNSVSSKIVISPIKELLFGDKVEISNDAEQTKIQSKFFGIMINPVNDNLYKALDEQFHYKTEYQGKQSNKDVWITRQPDYLFFFIQRTNYDKQLGVVKMKNKMKFDFQIYIDRYLYKNKHKQERKNPILIENIQKRDDTQKQISHLHALVKALEECHKHSSMLKQSPVELPKVQPLKQLIQRFETELKQTELTISKMESRQQKYTLRFIIVHRGEADSGHYWGYGFTSGCWWRYDINNSKIEKEVMAKEIEYGDVVVYALVYGRYEEQFHPSYQLFLNDEDLLGTDKNYNHFVSEQVRLKILNENKQRQKLHEDRKSAESISIITLEYEQKFRIVNEAIRKYNDKYSKVPYLNTFSGYLRWIGGQHPSLYFKSHLLDVALNSSTKYSIKEIPNEDFKNQLIGSFKQNLNKYSCPEKCVLTKLEFEKLGDKFTEFKKNVSAMVVLHKMLESIGLNLLEDALKCAYYVIQMNLRNYFENMAKEYFAVLALALTNANESIPGLYIQHLSKIDSKLYEQLSSVVILDDKKQDQQYRQMLEQLSRIDKQKQKQLYLATTPAQQSETTGQRLSEQIRKTLTHVGKYLKFYNKMITSTKTLKKDELFV